MKHLFSMKIALTLQGFDSMYTVGLFLIIFLNFVKFRILKIPIQKI